MTATISTQRQRQETEAKFEVVEEIESIAATVRATHPQEAERLDDLVTRVVDSVEPVKISVAAALLDLSRNTVVAWCKRGVLTSAPSSGSLVRTLDPHRFHRVLHLVNELRQHNAAGRGELLEQVYQRLQDQRLIDSPELQEGIAAWRAGDVVDA
jgi:DNA-binding transcriptional MerR regulator